MPEQTPADRQIARAKELERRRGELMELITANRDYLRLMDKNEELTEEQGTWLDVFYPVKEKGEQRSKADVEATRKAKEEARNPKPVTPDDDQDDDDDDDAPPAPPAKPAAKSAAKG